MKEEPTDLYSFIFLLLYGEELKTLFPNHGQEAVAIASGSVYLIRCVDIFVCFVLVFCFRLFRRIRASKIAHSFCFCFFF